MIKVRFLTCLWGKEYIDNFVDYSLPTQMGLGNIPDSLITSDSDFFIMSDTQGIEVLNAHPNIEKLKLIMNVTFFDISEIARDNKLTGVSHCQHEAIIRSKDFDYIFFIYPDFICGTGVIGHAISKLEEGFEAIACPVPRILMSCLEDPKFKKFFKDSALGRTISIPPRRLVELSFDHYHPTLDGNFIDGEVKNGGLAYLQWKVNPKTWLLHCFHLHPLAIKVKNHLPEFRLKFNVSLDEEFFPNVYPDIDKIYFPTHSDDYAMCSLSKDTDAEMPKPGQISLDNILRYAEGYASIMHREMVEKPFLWTSETKNEWESITYRPGKFSDISGASLNFETQEVEIEAKKFISLVKNKLNTPDKILKVKNRILYKERKDRRKRIRSRSLGHPQLTPFVSDSNSTEIEHLKNCELLLPEHNLFVRGLIWLRENTFLYKLNKYPFLVSLWLKIKN